MKRWRRRPMPLDRLVDVHLGGNQSVDDGTGVVAFEPAVSGDGAVAGAMSAGIHHDDAVTGAEKKFGLADDSDAVIGDAVEEKDPIAVVARRTDEPATKFNAVGSADVEVNLLRAGYGEGGVGVPDEVRRELAADGVEIGGAGQPARNCGQEWGEGQ